MQGHPIRRRASGPVLDCCVGTAFAALLLSGAALAAEPFEADPLVASELPAKPGAHWVWVNDFRVPAHGGRQGVPGRRRLRPSCSGC